MTGSPLPELRTSPCTPAGRLSLPLAVALIATALALAAGAAAAPAPPAPAPSSVPRPARQAAWRQVGLAVASNAGKVIRFYRTPLDAATLGIVVTSTSTQPIKLTWSSYCEFQSDDDITLEDFGTVTGARQVTAYPQSFPAATLCYVWVNAGASGTATVTAAIFAAPAD